MSMKKSFLRKRGHIETDMALQITSMADVFIIILVFLLKSYAGGSIDITPSKGLTLPVASTGPASADALKVEISESAILVESNPVSVVKNFAFAGNDMVANGTSKSLSAALEKERQRQLLIAKNNSDVKVDARIIVVADQRAPYSTIKAVLATAAVSGYTDFKLAVVNRE
jgi:biopolymer transport protein ExbD